MTFNIDSTRFSNDDFEITESSGDLVMTHKSTGATFTYDSGKSAWVPSNGLDLSGSDVSNVGALSTEVAKLDFQNTKDWVGGTKKISTTEDTEIYVDPNGDPDGAGTSADPITLKEAARRIPFWINHKYHIILKSGTYTQDFQMAGCLNGGKDAINPPFEIRGESGTRSDVTLEGNISLAIFHGESDVATLKDVTISSTLLQKWGNTVINNVKFDGAATPLTVPEGDVAINAHGRAYMKLETCDFGSNNYAVGAKMSDGSTIKASDVSGTFSHYPVFVTDDAVYDRLGNVANLYGKEGAFKATQGGQVFSNGDRWGDNPFLYDDFRDNAGAVNDRLRPQPQAFYYPEWDVNAGSPTIANEQLELANGDEVAEQVHMTRGEYVWDFKTASSPSSGQVDIRVAYTAFSDQVNVQIQNNGNVDLKVSDGGTTTTTISDTSTGVADGSLYRIKLTRDDTGHELFVGAPGSLSSAGTDSATNDVLGDGRAFHFIQNGLDAQFNVGRIHWTQSN